MYIYSKALLDSKLQPHSLAIMHVHVHVSLGWHAGKLHLHVHVATWICILHVHVHVQSGCTLLKYLIGPDCS